MIENYLEKLYQELYEKKLSKEQENQRLKIELNDNIRFIETLRESLDGDFESFSPRKIDENKHKEIESLIEKQKEIHEKIDKVQKEIENINIRIEELEEVLENFRQNQRYIDISFEQDKNIKNDLLVNFNNILDKVEACNKLTEVDPIRCKLELQIVEKNIRDIIQKLNTIV